MNFSVEFKNSAAMALKKFTQVCSKKIVDRLSEFETLLPAIEETKIKSNNPFHRIRFADYQIICEIQDDILVVLVIKIGHRKDIYRHIS